MISRRGALTALGASLAAGAWPSAAQQIFDPRGGDNDLKLTEAQRQAGEAFLRRHPSIDVHAHPGRFFLRDLTRQNATTRAMGAPFEAKALAAMAKGHVTAALFNCVSDAVLLEQSPTKGLVAARDFEPGEAWADYQRQIGTLQALVARGDAAPGRNGRDIAGALATGHTACVFAVEGGDFIEDRLERVHTAYADGVRSITIVHYHPNQIGDPQTETPRFPGLTPLGRKIVREMNRAGVLVDLAHASMGVTRDAVEVSTRPMMISHTNLKRPDVDHPRLVSAEHARLVTSHGGIVGSVPSGIGQKTVADWIASILRLVEVVGIDHVAIGTDMDANYMPVFSDYADWPLIPASLLAHGMAEDEVAKVMGGNFLRVMAAARP
ncbi:dipeptidase [Phenylobacterium sp.]|uniref:dipeptidase n=1 Tax=Phenylobacterium sp. TaxID=1871053 RepID=UPI002F3F30F9